jgi:hypothetical protein
MFLRLNDSGLMHLKISCLASSAVAKLVRAMTASLESADCEERFASEDSDPESFVDLHDILTRVFQQTSYGMTAEPKRQLLCIISQTVFREYHVGRLVPAAQNIRQVPHLEAVLGLLHNQFVPNGS